MALMVTMVTKLSRREEGSVFDSVTFLPNIFICRDFIAKSIEIKRGKTKGISSSCKALITSKFFFLCSSFLVRHRKFRDSTPDLGAVCRV
jgi:hypothetical protein